MPQKQRITLTDITTIANLNATELLKTIGSPTGIYQKSTFYDWQNFSSNNQPNKMTNNILEELTFHVSSFSDVAIFINSLAKIDTIEFTNGAGVISDFQITDETKVLSYHHSITLQNKRVSRIHDVLSNQETFPMASPIQYIFYTLRKEAIVDGRDDFTFDFFKQDSNKDEINHFKAPFLWFDGAHFQKEQTRNATQFVIECTSNEDANELLTIATNPDHINLEIDTWGHDVITLSLPPAHAYLEDENTVVVTSFSSSKQHFDSLPDAFSPSDPTTDWVD
ncbi:hypothetical protein YK48G_13490 [Lentilactobacillus fungorum]|uniref:Uncharacterized protein n=1 Tax=Lentilactobacillus fungorum TaxID=2201250 RepID=A0ABQ3W180_9LACO|nr:hypothetical protein [Lentilactobacillus fungorum]GHP13924.1 hypothetical protein YK48G_13490 [Lentilactobacillus fungorum]